MTDRAEIQTVSAGLAEWQALRAQAETLVRSGFLPKAINTAEKAVAIIQTGRELGIGPMQSLRSIHVIEGKPTLSAELMAGLVHRRIPGAVLRVVESTDAICVVEAGRPGQPTTRFVWSSDDAKRAGLTGKSNWRSYPRAMLRARCLTEAARSTFPDATSGLYDPDELGAVTDADGVVVDVARPVEPLTDSAPEIADTSRQLIEAMGEPAPAPPDWNERLSAATTLDDCALVVAAWRAARNRGEVDDADVPGFSKHAKNKKAKLEREADDSAAERALAGEGGA